MFSAKQNVMFLDYIFFELIKYSVKNKGKGYSYTLRLVYFVLFLNFMTVYLCVEQVMKRFNYKLFDEELYAFLLTMAFSGIYTFSAHLRREQIINKHDNDTFSGFTFNVLYTVFTLISFLIIISVDK
ncbi:hypothetical protein SAMN05421739_10138 [Pontibacter chinhatensis]|uniref:Uncharacterized protein n=1 Tax=Pontibacter chinhatensis TaxID=1436961 RepID=A0A1I2M0S0_9BACT|nr:hypothetical protein SAMN05421739_10138 [Pontibacter chinhatensis]